MSLKASVDQAGKLAIRFAMVDAKSQAAKAIRDISQPENFEKEKGKVQAAESPMEREEEQGLGSFSFSLQVG